jgi:hypothetical protein
MKLIILISVFIAFSINSNSQTRLKLKDAIAKGFVKVKIVGNNGHTGRCATVQTENTTSQVLDIDIDCGQKIQCSDSTAQNLVITQTEHVRISPKKIIATAVYAMCINAHKSSPGKVGFKLGAMASGALLRLTQFIEKKKYQNSHAQSAIWTITDNNSVATIGSDIDDEYEMTNALRGFIAREKHENFVVAKPKTRREKITDGTFDLIIQTKANVEVVLIDANNRIVKQFLRSPKDAGIVRFNYTIKNTDYKAGTYFIIARVGGKEVKREIVVLE